MSNRNVSASTLYFSRNVTSKAWDDAGLVQFAAAWRSPDGDGTLRERSRFTMIDGRWYYLDGVLG